MMKLLIGTLLILVSYFSVAQNNLEVLDTKNGKIRSFNTGSSFLFIPANDSIFLKGKIQSTTPDRVTLLLKEEDNRSVQYQASDFTVIRKPTTLQYISYAAGSVLMLGGTYFILTGRHISDNHWQARGIGAIGFALGLTPFLINPKTYEKSDRYKFQISE